MTLAISMSQALLDGVSRYWLALKQEYQQDPIQGTAKQYLNPLPDSSQVDKVDFAALFDKWGV